MTVLTIDLEKCQGCGKCEERCGFKKVISVNGSGKASFAPERKECIECYHCLMICPHGAIRGDGKLTVTGKAVGPSPVLTRHSCRVYAPKKVDKKLLQEVLLDANMAPRAYIDFTERRFIVVTGERMVRLRTFLLKRIESHARLFRLLVRIPLLPGGVRRSLVNFAWCFQGTTEANRTREQLFQGAPALVLVSGPARQAVSRTNSDYALMQLLISAEERGLGTCISGYIAGYARQVSLFLGLPKNEQVFCGAMVGYPAASFVRFVRRNDTSVTWL